MPDIQCVRLGVLRSVLMARSETGQILNATRIDEFAKILIPTLRVRTHSETSNSLRTKSSASVSGQQALCPPRFVLSRRIHTPYE